MSLLEKILVTGGAGFIGSAVVRHLVDNGYKVINVDALTYSGNLESLREVARAPNYRFVKADIRDFEQISQLLRSEQPDAIMHLAAETHVDRSIDGPEIFVDTNVVGTFRLLEAALNFWRSLDEDKRRRFRFHHVSTDEVYGQLPIDNGRFTEETRYAPSSPYSASKAAADHFVRAWHHTYGLPIVLSNCSNNYGPYQFPEKLIPLIILNAMSGKKLPVYGRGEHVRDWLYVGDHATALEVILTRGRVGESYNVGGCSERANLAVVKTICDILDSRAPPTHCRKRRELIEFVPDRPGHDLRYSIDTAKIERELAWTPQESFESGLQKTVDWYLANDWWWRPIREQHYAGERLGVAR